MYEVITNKSMEELVNQISTLVANSKDKLVSNVNQIMTETYWKIYC